jgi:hypothetical protein
MPNIQSNTDAPKRENKSPHKKKEHDSYSSNYQSSIAQSEVKNAQP